MRDPPLPVELADLLVLAGLPEPEINVKVRNGYGDVVRRYDLYYRRSRTAIEYQGRHHIDRKDTWHGDLRHREESENAGDRILELTSRDLFVDPESTLQRIEDVLRMRGEPGLPKRLAAQWRPHFPGQVGL